MASIVSLASFRRRFKRDQGARSCGILGIPNENRNTNPNPNRNRNSRLSSNSNLMLVPFRVNLGFAFRLRMLLSRLHPNHLQDNVFNAFPKNSSKSKIQFEPT